MTTLPVREMVLYKHGVGFFVRQGELSGDSLTLTFREDEINDALKSLAVFDHGGGHVLGIHYPTPMDMPARLASSSIKLPSESSLRGLITDLRGRNAELMFEVAPGSLEAAIGRIVGMEQPETAGSEVDARALSFVTLLDESGQVRIIRLDALRTVRILDPQAAYDLSYFLDTAVGDDARRSVYVRMSPGEHDLTVYYVAPSPVWRVSYRLVAESNEGMGTGKALLQGWGLFDNRLEEDLENVRVTLVAGQPISFVYDLSSSTIPRRQIVRDEARIAPGPIEYDADDLDFLEQERERSDDRPGFAKVASARYVAAGMLEAAPEERARGISMGSVAASAPAQAATRDSGEFFQYSVASPVSVKRGESALVPILNAEIVYSRELLYNRAKLPNHPVAALRFTNSTGLTLERGPLTLVEDGDYKGDAVIPFTRDAAEIYAPYAVELGIAVSEIVRNSAVTRGIYFHDAMLVEERYYVTEVTYSIENRTNTEQTVTIEVSLGNPDAELFETDLPDFVSAAERRWRVPAPARSRTQFVRKERTLLEAKTAVRKLKFEALRDFLAHRWLDEATFEALSGLFAAIRVVQETKDRLASIEQDRATIFAQQEQVRGNLMTLQPTGQEAILRQRVLAQFEALQDRLEVLTAEEASLKVKQGDLEAQINTIIAALPQKSQ